MRRIILFGFALMACLSNCTKDHSKDQNCQNCPVISFKNDIIPIFQASCAVSGCHTGAFPAGNVNLDSAVAYTQSTAAGKGYVNAGNPGTSILYLEMIPGSTTPMPTTGLLNACTANKISCWIQQGALNN